jgi:hypothetical protein
VFRPTQRTDKSRSGSIHDDNESGGARDSASLNHRRAFHQSGNDDVSDTLRLQCGQVVDAKNTCQSFSLIAALAAENEYTGLNEIPTAEATNNASGSPRQRSQTSEVPPTVPIPPIDCITSAPVVSFLSSLAYGSAHGDQVSLVRDSVVVIPPFATACLVHESTVSSPLVIRLPAGNSAPVLTTTSLPRGDIPTSPQSKRKARLVWCVAVLVPFGVLIPLILVAIRFIPIRKAAIPSLTPTVTTESTESGNRTRAILDFINNHTLTGRTIRASMQRTNLETDLYGEELAVDWLIHDDPLQLSPDALWERFRLLQRYALLTIRFQQSLTADWPSNGSNSTWLSTVEECAWQGIGCQNVTIRGTMQGVVTKLDLAYTGLQGTLSPELGLLSSLVSFVTSSDALTGSLPKSIGQWSLLESFDVSYNELSGSLPDTIGQWKNIAFVSVSMNLLRGTLPTMMAQWSNLTYLDLMENEFTGALPNDMGGWTKVDYIVVAYNRLRGTLPSTLRRLTALTVLYAQSNSFSGTIPDTLGNWSNLVLVNLANNTLTGSLPASLNLMSNLMSFDVSNNRLVGTVSELIAGGWKNLSIASLQGNNFTGTIAASICNTSRTRPVVYLWVDCVLAEQCSCCACPQ